MIPRIDSREQARLRAKEREIVLEMFRKASELAVRVYGTPSQDTFMPEIIDLMKEALGSAKERGL